QSVEHGFGQSALMLLDDVIRAQQSRAAVGSDGICCASEIGQVLHACRNAGDTFMIERSPLPAIRNGVSVGANLVGLETVQMLALAIKYAHMWAIKLVG